MLIDFQDEWVREEEDEERQEIDIEEIIARTDTTTGNELRNNVQVHVVQQYLSGRIEL